MSFQKVSINKVRDFWDRRPCNIRHSISPVGTKKYFEEVERRKYLVEPHIPRFADFNRWRNKRVLEIGCGIGTDTINFARNGAKVTAVEISNESLKIAKQRAKIYGFQNRIKFYLVNAEELSKVIPVQPYDLIYSFGVIHHSPHPEKIIKEIKKYTDNHTIVKIMIYNRYSWKVFWILFKYAKGKFWNLNRVVAENSEAATGSPVTYIYSKKQAKELLSGFKIFTMSVDHIFPYTIPEYKKYQYKKVWYFRYLPRQLFRRLETTLGWHLLITARIAA